MARYDKYDPVSGGFRARLAADWAAADGVPIGVGLDANGHVVPGAGTSGVIGVLVLVSAQTGRGKANDVIDVMTHGEIVELTDAQVGGTLAAGIPIYADNTSGALNIVGTGATKVGYTVELDRLVVRKAA
jgi:hypothetical protein